MNTDQLKQILQDQRSRRMAKKPIPSPPGKGMNWKTFFTLLGVTLISIGVFIAMIYLSNSSAASAPAPETTIHPATVSPTVTTLVPTPVISASAKVCTRIPDGRLHVRFTQGDGSKVRGYLAEGENVQVVLNNGQLESQIVKGESWLHLLSPVEGWTNAAYICGLHNDHHRKRNQKVFNPNHTENTMLKIITIASDKGGVAKTTTTLALAGETSQCGRNCLIADFDPQGQCAVALGRDQEPGAFNMLVNTSFDLHQWIRPTGRERLDIIPGNRMTATAQVVINAENRGIDTIRQLLKPLRESIPLPTIEK